MCWGFSCFERGRRPSASDSESSQKWKNCTATRNRWLSSTTTRIMFMEIQTVRRWVVLFSLTSVTLSLTSEHACNVIVICKASVGYIWYPVLATHELKWPFVDVVWLVVWMLAAISPTHGIDLPRGVYHCLVTNLVSLLLFCKLYIHWLLGWFQRFPHAYISDSKRCAPCSADSSFRSTSTPFFCKNHPRIDSRS